jgi:hypothetical protein
MIGEAARRCDVREGAVLTVEHRRFAARFLPAADDDVSIGRIDLQEHRAPPGALRRDHRRAGATEGIEHGVAPLAAVEDRPLDQRHRLRRRMQVVPRRLV